MNPKEQILKAAASLFSKKGFSATSVREIAALASVNLAMVNYYFKSKSQLLEDMLKISMTSVMQLTKEVMAADCTEIEKINRIIDLHADYIFTNREISLIFFQQQLAVSNPALKKMLQELTEVNIRNFEQTIHAGQEKGIFSKSVNPTLLYASLLGTIHQVILMGQIIDMEALPVKIIEKRNEIVLYLKSICKQVLMANESCNTTATDNMYV